MKKLNYFIISLLILLLIPKSIYAANSPSLNKSYDIKVRNLTLSEIGISDNKNKYNNTFNLYEAYNSSNSMFFHIYSLKNTSVDASLTLICKDKITIEKNQEELLNLLLSNINQINLTNSEDILNITNQRQLLNAVAAQILVWEIMNNERTSFDNVSVNSDYFKNLVNINRNNTLSSGLPSLYDVYSSIVKNVNEKNTTKSTNSKDNPYVLYYNVNNERYQNVISSLDYNTLTTTYDIKNNTEVKLSSSSNGLLAYTSSNNYFTDVKAIPIEQKKGSTNTDLQNFYYFSLGTSNFVLASKADVVPQNLYFKCAQGNFKLLTLEGSGRVILGATYQIKKINGETLKFTSNSEKNTFTYDNSGTGEENIVYSNANTYVINEIPDGEYNIIQTAVPVGNSFPLNEEDRTIKIKIENGNFYVYNKILGKYEVNQMRIIKFNSYMSKLYILDSEYTGNEEDTYKIVNSNNQTVLLYKSNKNYYQAYNENLFVESENFILDNNTKRMSIYGLPAGDYKIISNRRTSDKERSFSIKNDNTIGDSIFISFDTSKNEINFYKLDENGKYLDGGMFSLRVLESEDNYIDVPLSKIDDSTYEVKENAEEYTFSVQKGKIKIKGLSEGKTYRIVELTPPDGYSVFDANKAYVDVNIDSLGYASSTPYMVNKQILVKSDASSNSELILSIRTGKEIIKYGLIILGLGIFVILLLIAKKKILKN